MDLQNFSILLNMFDSAFLFLETVLVKVNIKNIKFIA